MDRRDGLDGKPGFFVLLVSVLYTPQVLMTSPPWSAQNGGAAAILPYVIGVIILGIPLVFLEISLGQFMQRSGTRLWAVSPLFKGVAIVSMVSSLVRSSVNCIMASWAGFYIYLTLTNQIPTCNTTTHGITSSQSNAKSDWFPETRTIPTLRSNTSLDFLDAFFHPTPHVSTGLDGGRIEHGTLPFTDQNVVNHNITTTHSTSGAGAGTSWNSSRCAHDFMDVWRKDILEATTSMTSPGQSVLHLFIGNAVIVFVSVFVSVFGVGVMRKVVTSLLPVTIALSVAILTYACLTYDVMTRLTSMWTSDFGLLTHPDTWFRCFQQVIVTHGLSVGVLPSLSSFLRWNNGTFRDAIITCFLTAAIHVLTSLIVLSVSGSLAAGLDFPTPHPFSVISLSLSLLPHPTVWSVLFFLLLIVVIITTNVIYWEVAILTVTDASRKLSKWRPLLVIGAASFVFLLTVSLSLQNGVYTFRLLEMVVFGPFLIGVICLIQTLVIAFVYGGHKFYDNLETMTGWRPHWWMRFAWAWVCPGVLLASLCFHGYRMYSNPIILGTSDPLPDLSNTLLVVVIGMMLLPVPLTGVWVLCSGPVGCIKKLKWSVQPRLQPYQIPIKWRLDRKWHKFSPL